MTDKEKIIAMFERLPDDLTIQQGVYHLEVLSKVERRLTDKSPGKDHDQLMAELEMRYGEEKTRLASSGGSRSSGNRRLHSPRLSKKRPELHKAAKNGRKKA